MLQLHGNGPKCLQPIHEAILWAEKPGKSPDKGSFFSSTKASRGA